MENMSHALPVLAGLESQSPRRALISFKRLSYVNPSNPLHKAVLEMEPIDVIVRVVRKLHTEKIGSLSYEKMDQVVSGLKLVMDIP